MKKKYNWEFDRVNSKGEAKFKHKTGENLEDVEKFLKDKDILYSVRQGARMIWVYTHKEKFAYYYTTGRWSPFIRGGMPSKHYRSIDVEDFYTRFFYPTLQEEEATIPETEYYERYYEDHEDERHLGCLNFPVCDLVGCGEH